MNLEKIYKTNRIITVVNFRLIVFTRNRIYKSVKGMTKQLSTKEFVGIDVNLYNKWNEYQNTPEMNWSNMEIDHVRSVCMSRVSKDKEITEGFNRKNTQPILEKDLHHKRTKFSFLDYQLQFIRAYQFIKLIEERLNQDSHC